MNVREEFITSDNFAEATMFPLLDLVAGHLEKRGNLQSIRVAWNCHLTALTAVAARALLASGCDLYICECNPGTSDEEAIAYMEELGIKIFRGDNARKDILKEQPNVISDTGLDLLTEWFQQKENRPDLMGACEITTSGITRLKEFPNISIPIVNINDGRIKSQIENFHGVGDGLLNAVIKLQDQVEGIPRKADRPTGRLNARTACVVGYGRVGAGVADYLSRHGIEVTVVDSDPVRQLQAHFDRFALAKLEDALKQSDLVVTATGTKGLMSKSRFRLLKDGALVLNVGHWREELDLEGLRSISLDYKVLGEDLDQYIVIREDGNSSRIHIATKGDPANVALVTGSVEPTLLHLATEMLCIEYVIANHGSIPSGEVPVPLEVENTVARMALQAFGFEI